MAVFQKVRKRRVAGTGELDEMTDRIADDRELAGQADQGIDLLGVDSEGACRNLRRLHAASAVAATAEPDSPLSNCARASCSGCAESSRRLCSVACDIRGSELAAAAEAQRIARAPVLPRLPERRDCAVTLRQGAPVAP